MATRWIHHDDLRTRSTRGVATSERDLLEGVLRAMDAAPGDAYWGRRLLDLLREPAAASRHRARIVAAVKSWVSVDPSFFVHERYLSEQLAVWAWPREVLEELDATLRTEDPSLAHLVLGRLWLEARRPEDVPELYVRAARHLRAVARHLRIGAWHEAICEALGVADPAELARRAGELLDSAPPSARERALLAILRGAARAGDWALYDAHRREYGALAMEGAVGASLELARLDGQRAEQCLVRPATLPSFARRRSPARRADPAPSPRPSEALTVRPPSRPQDMQDKAGPKVP